MGYFHEESWKPYNGWEGRDGGERELMLGRVWKGKGLRQGLLLTQGLWTQFWVSYLCWQFVTLAIREIRREMFTEGFLWRGEGATRCYNYFSFSFSFEYSFPLSLGLLLPHFQGSPYPIKPQESDLGLVEQAGAQLQHCCVGTAALFAERSKGERENGTRCKQRGGMAVAPHPSPAWDPCQLCKHWAGANYRVRPSPSSCILQQPLSRATRLSWGGPIPWENQWKPELVLVCLTSSSLGMLSINTD